MMRELKSVVNSILPIREISIGEILNIVKIRDITGGTCFVEKGKRNQSEYFLIDGVCRSYLLNPEGDEITISFFNSGSVLSPYVTRTIKGISNINFQALTDITIGEMDASKFEALMVNNLEIREFGNTVLKMELQKKVQKEINLASLTALERLQIFRDEYPGFENIVPHTTISTFLGITNVSLSRLRQKKR
jgi:CRP-like cAMP-binding protein